MMKVLGYSVAGILGLVLVWMVVSFVIEQGIQEPSYIVEQAADGYEVRRYKPYLLAEVEIAPGAEDPLGVGYQTLSKYIRGANQGKRKIDMTAPVLKHEQVAEKIQMNKPASDKKKPGVTKVAFVLPADYTLETVPLPENQLVRIREVPERRLAVIRFSGFATDALMDEKRKELVSLLDRDGLQPVGASLMAYYNPPWTPPFMRRNEVMFAIE